MKRGARAAARRGMVRRATSHLHLKNGWGDFGALCSHKIGAALRSFGRLGRSSGLARWPSWPAQLGFGWKLNVESFSLCICIWVGVRATLARPRQCCSDGAGNVVRQGKRQGRGRCSECDAAPHAPQLLRSAGQQKDGQVEGGWMPHFVVLWVDKLMDRMDEWMNDWMDGRVVMVVMWVGGSVKRWMDDGS